VSFVNRILQQYMSLVLLLIGKIFRQKSIFAKNTRFSRKKMNLVFLEKIFVKKSFFFRERFFKKFFWKKFRKNNFRLIIAKIFRQIFSENLSKTLRNFAKKLEIFYNIFVSKRLDIHYKNFYLLI
jgi:hypothetical protein